MVYLERSSIPKLMLYTIPGFLTTIEAVVWCRQHLENLTLIDLGQGLHFVQEYNPKGFSDALANWYVRMQDIRIRGCEDVSA